MVRSKDCRGLNASHPCSRIFKSSSTDVTWNMSKNHEGIVELAAKSFIDIVRLTHKDAEAYDREMSEPNWSCWTKKLRFFLRTFYELFKNKTHLKQYPPNNLIFLQYIHKTWKTLPNNITNYNFVGYSFILSDSDGG